MIGIPSGGNGGKALTVSAAMIWLSLTLIGVTAVRAQHPRWVETHSWSGRSPVTTEIFRVNGGKWRVVSKHRSGGRLQIEVFDRDHRLVNTLAHETALFHNLLELEGPGYYYLRIRGVGDPWQITVKQHLTTIEEWTLLQSMRTARRELARLATWTGSSGSEQYTFEVPAGSWKMRYRTFTDGDLQITLAPVGENEEGATTYSRRELGSSNTWRHHPGRYRITVQAGDTRWRVDVLYHPR